MRTDTKAYRILQMHKSGATFASIADHLGVSRAYVRVVVRQRGEAGRSIYDDRYVASDKGRAMAARIYARNRHRMAAYGAAWNMAYAATGSRTDARAAGRKAYTEASDA